MTWRVGFAFIQISQKPGPQGTVLSKSPGDAVQNCSQGDLDLRMLPFDGCKIFARLIVRRRVAADSLAVSVRISRQEWRSVGMM